LTGPDQRDKDPEPADKWENVQTKNQVTQEEKLLMDLKPGKEWEEEWEEAWAVQP
jgi:hypothetical protein